MREIRVFTDRGGPLVRIRPPASAGPPYAITAGDLVASRAGDEVAVASRSGAGGRTVLLYASDGRLLRTVHYLTALYGRDLAGLNRAMGSSFTRYGVWYRAPHDMVHDAHAAGFGMMSIGEYQALTPDVEAAFGQLRFLADHGVAFAHCMSWPAEHECGSNASMDAALRRLFAEDRPRPGVAGGVGEVRTARAGGRECAVVCVGSGPDRTGLLKSLRADGSWEGSVCGMPFHARVAVTPLRVARTAVGEPWVCGPLKGLASGCQVDLLFRASGTRVGVGATWSVRRGGRVLPGLMARIAVGRAAARARCVLRVQLPVDGVEVALQPDPGVRVSEVSATLEREETPRVAEGRLEARAPGGGRHVRCVAIGPIRRRARTTPARRRR